MDITGRRLILAIVVLALLMAGGGWWYRYEQSRRCAGFWGAEAAQLLTDPDRVRLLELGPAAGDQESAGERLADMPVEVVRDLTQARGLVHLQFALTQDANFAWDSPPAGTVDWSRALEFTRGERTLWVLLTADAAVLGKLTAPDGEPQVLSCPRLAEPVTKYLDAVR